MPGDNWAVFGCGSCRRTKGIGIWKLPAPKDDAHQKWREDWLNEITKTREIDQDFRERIKNDGVYTCEKHFPPEDIEIFSAEKMTKKKPKFGAIPKLNMPKKSHESIQPTPRPGRSVVKDMKEQPAACYKDFTELCRRVKGLKCLSEWNAKNLSDRVVFKKTVDPFLIPELEIIVDDTQQ